MPPSLTYALHFIFPSNILTKIITLQYSPESYPKIIWSHSYDFGVTFKEFIYERISFASLISAEFVT